MMNRILSILLFFTYVFTATGQITTSPALPTTSESITITFDSSKDSRLGFFTGDLYAHTGVIVEGDSNWKYVIESWGNNTTQPKLTNKGGGIYELIISPDVYSFYSIPQSEKVTKLAFVFRSASGSQQTNDLFVDVYEEGLVVKLEEPAHNSIFEQGEAITISATTSLSSTLKLFLNDTELEQVTGTSISTTYAFNDAGNYWLIAESDFEGETVRDSAYICVKGEVVNETKPSAYRRGINYPTDNSAALVLWAPNKQFVYVLGDFNNWRPDNNYQMKKDGDYFWLEIDGLEKGKEYVFQYFIDNEILIADPYTEKISDPWNDSYISEETYPGLIAYPEGKTEGIASVLQPGQEKYQWEVSGFEPPGKEKMVIYELLVRDFTEEHTFQAVIDKLDYLKDLRINVLELMPVNEFEGNSSWGYNPSFYFAPDKYYGPKNKLKKLIDECHKRGIAVVIDMVLNHSYGQSPFVQMYMDDWVVTPDNPWYNQESNFQNSSLRWGYDFNHDSEATRALADSINSFWMKEYRVDGFRFDFTKGFSNTTYGPSSWGSEYDASRINNLERMADEIWKRNENALVIFEHLAYNSEEKVLAGHGIFLWGKMNHNYSEAAKGSTSSTDLTYGLYTSRDWAEPNLVTYMESHDEERVTYLCRMYGNSYGDYQIRDTETAFKRMELASVFLIPLPGPKMIWQFGERGYDQSIDSYGGRLSEKPPLWNYLDNTARLELFSVVAKLNYLKQTYEEFSPGEFSYGLDGEFKYYILNNGSNHVVVVGNFGVREASATISFPEKGQWNEYFTHETLNLTHTSKTVILAPGEYRLYSKRQFETPHISTNAVTISLADAGFELYPNPATEKILIRSDNPIQKIQIYSVSGQMVFSRDYPDSKNAEINVGQFTSGIYMVNLQQKNKILSRKFIIH